MHLKRLTQSACLLALLSAVALAVAPTGSSGRVPCPPTCDVNLTFNPTSTAVGQPLQGVVFIAGVPAGTPFDYCQSFNNGYGWVCTSYVTSYWEGTVLTTISNYPHCELVKAHYVNRDSPVTQICWT